MRRVGRWLRRHPFLTAMFAVVCVGVGAYLLERDVRVRRHWRQAEEAIAARDFARAQSELDAFLSIRPDSAEAHFLVGHACRRAHCEDFAGARSHLFEARRLQLRQPGLGFEFDLLDFQESGLRDERERRLHLLLADPSVDRRIVLEALARGCIRGERLDEAVTWLDRWVGSYPDDWYVYFIRGTLHQHMDKPALAVADLERVLLLKRDTPDINLRLGVAHVKQGTHYPVRVSGLEDV